MLYAIYVQLYPSCACTRLLCVCYLVSPGSMFGGGTSHVPSYKAACHMLQDGVSLLTRLHVLLYMLTISGPEDQLLPCPVLQGRISRVTRPNIVDSTAQRSLQRLMSCLTRPNPPAWKAACHTWMTGLRILSKKNRHTPV